MMRSVRSVIVSDFIHSSFLIKVVEPLEYEQNYKAYPSRAAGDGSYPSAKNGKEFTMAERGELWISLTITYENILCCYLLSIFVGLRVHAGTNACAIVYIHTSRRLVRGLLSS